MVTTVKKELEDSLNYPPEHTEWVDGKLVEKTGMTFQHSVVQANLTLAWETI